MTDLTPHFTLEEMNREGHPVPAQYLANAQAVAELLEAMRAAGGGVPLDITSGYRTPRGNELAGGVSASQHLTASAVDFEPRGVDGVEWSRRVLAQRDTLPAFGQWIIYPWSDDHIHVSLPGKHVGQVLVETGKNLYAVWDGVDDPAPRGSGSVGASADAPTGEGLDSALKPWVWFVLAVCALIIVSELV
jgi:zinc D-Ala-D-Ala carboxypeptidase